MIQSIIYWIKTKLGIIQLEHGIDKLLEENKRLSAAIEYNMAELRKYFRVDADV